MRIRSILLAVFVLWLPLLTLSSLVGCSCQKDPTQAKLDEIKKKLEEEKKKKAKPKPDYEMGLLSVQPNNLVDRQFMVKPGHLTSVSVDLIANNFDVKGEMVTDPLSLDGVAYSLGNARPAILPKGQPRNFEIVLQYPEAIPGVDREELKHFSCRLNADGGRMLLSTPGRLSRMPAHQFYFMVLAKSQDSYKYLSQLPSFKPTASSLPGEDPQGFYRLVLPPVIKRTPLPETPLAWTSMAYLLWDGMEKDSLTPEQHEALVDWLHWGGQLIISGPGTLTLLQGSPLDPYLPATPGGTVTLDQPQFQSLGFLEGKEWAGPQKLNKPWECQELKIKDETTDQVLAWTGNEQGRIPLVVERSVGRGRIVVTAFRLNQPEIADWRTAWQGFDEFFNAFVLRRHPRSWTYLEVDDAAALAWRVNGRETIAQSPREVSRLSYFARDTGAGKHKPTWLKGDPRAINNNNLNNFQPQMVPDQFGRMVPITGDLLDLERFEGPGPAAWDDFNDVAHSARGALEEAAGIKVPERMFVVKTLALYLFVLVPVNWCVFAVLRRLEWAWVAVPIITVAFTGVVVKMAELNIGFARSRTEVAVVEVQGEHTRAHLTRYTALYTSLSTRYDVRLAESTGMVQPLSGKDQLAVFQLQSRRPLWLHRDNEVWLEGFEVGSNSRGMLHAEQLFDIKGPIKVVELSNDRVKVLNQSEYDLRDAQVVGPQGLAKLGDLAAGSSAEGEFRDPAPKRTLRDELQAASEETPETEEPASASAPAKKASDNVRLDDLLTVARLVEDKSVRLVAWSDEPLPGMEIHPAASQNRHANVFVVHLRPPPQPTAEKDKFASKEARDAFLKKPVKPKPPEDFELGPDPSPNPAAP